MADLWLIWSNEHRAWWGPAKLGYFTNTDRAGRYTREHAAAICAQANVVPRDPPNEVMVLAPPLAQRTMTLALSEMTNEEFMRAIIVEHDDPPEIDPENPPVSEEEMSRMKLRRPR